MNTAVQNVARATAIAIALVHWSTASLAYGPLGHELVGGIAGQYLCAEAASETRKLLGGESLGRAGRWPDWIRSRPQWRHTRPWHYINVPDQGDLAALTGSADGDVIWAIDAFTADLADPNLSARRRTEALQFLVHFIADVHQPLHVGRAEDRGGNSIEVRVGGRRLNLHQFWDAQQMLKDDQQTQRFSVAEQIDSLAALITEADRRNPGGALEWAAESQALRPAVYDFAPPGAAPTELDEAYQQRAWDITRRRLALAGWRLAATLTRVYCAQDADISQ